MYLREIIPSVYMISILRWIDFVKSARKTLNACSKHISRCKWIILPESPVPLSALCTNCPGNQRSARGLHDFAITTPR